MKKVIIVFVMLGGLISCAIQSIENPQAEISNGIIKAHLYLPDAQIGYYQGTRFDWSGIISSLEYKDHNYFGQWFKEYSPTKHDAVMGPAEAFSPLNYEEADSGGTFIQIGVGAMTKPSDEKHNTFNTYPIVDPGIWKVEQKADKVQFMQVLNNANFSYEYTKSVQLIKDKPEMVISHILKNTGERTIETSVFNHNFFVIDNQPTGEGFTLTFPVNVSGTGKGMGDIIEIHGKKIIFKRDMVEGEHFMCKSLEGINGSVKDFDIRVDNLNTGAGVRITGDQPLSKLVFWGSSTTLCPETYIDIKLEPGEDFTWSYFYEFYTSDIAKQ